MIASTRLLRGACRFALLLALLVAPAAVEARIQPEETPRRTVLTLDPLDSVPMGRSIDVYATLVNLDQEPQDNKVLEFYLDGVYLRRARTDIDGRARIRLPHDLPLGTYEVRSEFIGTEAYGPSSANGEVTVRNAHLTIEVVPPLPGVPVQINGVEAISGPDGIIHHEVENPDHVELEVLQPEQVEVDPTVRAVFERWGDNAFSPTRTIAMRGDRTLQLGFGLRHRVQIVFHDQRDGRSVPWERVDSLVLKGANGTYVTFRDGLPHWLPAGRVMRASTGLYFSPLLYSVESVNIDGTNVVNRYQQRFYAEPESVWPVDLLLYSAVFRARDAVLGFELGSGIDMEYPDGWVETYDFDENGEVYLDQLARGLYRVQVLGVKGVAPPTPVALSRDQDVSLKVLSMIDIIAGVTLGLTLALGLLLYGRPALFGLPWRRRDRPLAPTSSD